MGLFLRGMVDERHGTEVQAPSNPRATLTEADLGGGRSGNILPSSQIYNTKKSYDQRGGHVIRAPNEFHESTPR